MKIVWFLFMCKSADGIEDDILTGRIEERVAACYSQVTLAKELRVNPATAAKGINLLVNRGILIKHRAGYDCIRKCN